MTEAWQRLFPKHYCTLTAAETLAATAIRGDVFVLSGGSEVIANLPDPMSGRDYEDLKDWLELMIRKAGRKVMSEPSTPTHKSSEDKADEQPRA